jgi:ParB family transcriptional regulator, chromosome partitioning protein
VTGVQERGSLLEVDPESIRANPDNPRRYFNEERLDLLRTSIQEVGVLVPLIVYRDDADGFVLMDGERRWRCALDLALGRVPVNVIARPDPLDNLLRMFNIHNVREDWPLISVALSLREVMTISGEQGEKRLSELTGLTRSTVRRAKRILSLPQRELDLIQSEAHLDRTQQVHREDLYLEIQAAESVLREALPGVAAEFSRDEVIRSFAAKAEQKTLGAVTDFRLLGKIIKSADADDGELPMIEYAVSELVRDVRVTPREVFDNFAAEGYRQQTLQRKAQVLVADLDAEPPEVVSVSLRGDLVRLREAIDRVLGAS